MGHIIAKSLILFAIMRPAVTVDLKIVNQYNGPNGIHFYDSYFDIEYHPPFGIVRMPVFVWRGWHISRPTLHTTGGFATMFSEDTVVVARRVIYIVSPYDFEYRNRQYRRPIE